jgi:DNA-binding MarR family transcriptional regulator
MPITPSEIKLFYKKLLFLEREVEKQLGGETHSCCGVSFSQCHVLLAIEEASETSITNLAETLKLDKSTLSRTIDQLVGTGLISRVINPDDRRYMNIRLTEQGKQIMSMTYEMCNNYFKLLFQNIPADKHDAVIESIELLTNAMGQINRPDDKVPVCGCCKDC